MDKNNEHYEELPVPCVKRELCEKISANPKCLGYKCKIYKPKIKVA